MKDLQAVSTGPAIEGCEDPWEELALAFSIGTRKQAKELTEYLELKEALAGLKRRIEELKPALAKAREAHAAAVVALDALRGIPFADPLLAVGATLAVIGIPAMLLNIPWLRLLACAIIPIGLTCAIIALVKRFRARSAAAQAVLVAEAAVGQADQALQAVTQQAEEARERLKSMSPKKSVRAVGRVYFPARVVELGGRSVALDSSGTVPHRRFKLADFEFSSKELDEIVANIESLRNPPVLLAPDEAATGKLDELHGEERGLRDTVERFAEFVGRIPTTEVDLPVIPNARPIAAELAAGVRPNAQFPGAVLRDRRDLERDAAVGRLNSTLGTSKARGVGPKMELLNAHTAIANLLELYRSLRTTSMTSIHQQFLDAMSRSSWCKVRYYCPKATRNPAWILRRLAIEIDTAHEANQDELISRLSSDPDIEARMADKPELMPALERAWSGIQNVRADIARIQGASAQAASSVGMATTPTPATLSGALRYLNSQLEQYVAEYRIALNKVVFGQRQPLVEFSSQPLLRFDPETSTWSNETAGTEYTDLEEISCSRVLRVHEELLHPMWTHLWTEKADFRRSELFRTNEQMLRMNEKESEKLISIGNQFRDDMRTTRDVLKQVSSELDGKIQQLRGTRDALVSLGLVAEDDQGPLSEESIGSLGGGGTDTIRRAEEKETLLALEPQAQAERRELAVDPINVIADPSNLFQESMSAMVRRTLARPGAEAAAAALESRPDGGGAT